MSKILITGNACYVGAVLTLHLLSKGHKFTSININKFYADDKYFNIKKMQSTNLI